MSAFTDDTWYRREIVTPELDECCDRIAAGLRIPRSNVGTKGDENHRRGHHRSQEWILNSPFCTNRTYTVQAGLTAEQARHIAAIDIIPGEWGTTENRRRTAAITARVIAAMKADELDEVLEVYGAAADLKTVTGYNNRENRAASSDSSHLDHPHLGIDRRKLRDRAFLQRLASIVIGDDMATPKEVWTHDLKDGDGTDPAYKVLNRADVQSAKAVALGDANGKALAELAGKVDALASPDLDALADKVADRLAAKLNLGFVPASPPAQG